MDSQAAKRVGTAFSVLCGIGLFTCLLCDVLITGSITWAAYPAISIPFGWLVVMTFLLSDRNKTRNSQAALSILTLPFLLALDLITPGQAWFAQVALPIGAISIVFFWISYFAYKKIHRFFALLAVYVFQYGVLLNSLIQFVVSRYANDAFPQIDLIITLLSSIALTVFLVRLDARKARIAASHR